MLLHKLDSPFNDDSFITELKLDGFRAIWTKFGNKVKIYTRHNNEITSMFPELLNLPISNGVVLDGEIIVTDSQGKPDFEAVMERFRSRKSQHNISFSAFDIIYYNNKRITNLPLYKRKEILSKVISEDSPLLNKVQWVKGNGVQYFELIKQHDLEGIVQKKANSNYQINKRSYDWLKVINYKFDSVYISGLRKDKFGLLLLFNDGSYAGKLDFMSPEERKQLYKLIKPLITKEDENYIYLKPKLKIVVKYRNLTKKGLLRIPVFVEWL